MLSGEACFICLNDSASTCLTSLGGERVDLYLREHALHRRGEVLDRPARVLGMDANAAIGIVERRGLNHFKYVEFEIQEQQAPWLLPLRKVPGPRNPSDMMTKNVNQAHIDLYLDLLNLRFGMGRADIAQNLFSIRGK